MHKNLSCFKKKITTHKQVLVSCYKNFTAIFFLFKTLFSQRSAAKHCPNISNPVKCMNTSQKERKVERKQIQTISFLWSEKKLILLLESPLQGNTKCSGVFLVRKKKSTYQMWCEEKQFKCTNVTYTYSITLTYTW